MCGTCVTAFTPPLIRAATNGDSRAVRMLVQCQHANTEVVDENTGMRAMHVAAMQGHTKVVQALLECKAAVSAQDERGIGMYAYSPLALACRGCHVEVVRLLLEARADVDATVRDFAEKGYSKAPEMQELLLLSI